MTKKPPFHPWFYTVLAVLFFACFLFNVFTHTTVWGLISTGGVTLVMVYEAYRAWNYKRSAATPDTR